MVLLRRAIPTLASPAALPPARQGPTKGSKTMSSDLNQTSSGATGVTVDHVLAGLAVWAVLMVIYALL